MPSVFIRARRIGRASARLAAVVFGLAACAGSGDKIAPPVLTTVTVSLPSTTITVGQTVNAAAIARDQDEQVMNGAEVTWSSSATAVASVAANGVVTGVSEGTAEIIARAGGKEGRAAITVGPAPVFSVTLSATSLSIFRGATRQLSATTKDAQGNTLAGRPIAWSSSNAAQATVSGSGLVTAVAIGQATITATSEGKSSSVAVDIVVQPAAGVDSNSSYMIAQQNARASLIDWTSTQDVGKMQTARAVADLDNDGLSDAVVAPGIFLEQNASVPMRFYKGTAAGNGGITIADNTAAWLNGTAPSINHGRKIIFGDYNRDGVKDVFVCAHGYDASPFPGTKNALFLSGNGKWTQPVQPWNNYIGFHHGCASGDLNNDGDLDIIVLDSKGISYVLINDGTGNFNIGRSGIPEDLNRTAPVFSVEVLDVDKDGYNDFIVGGGELYQPTVIYWGDGTGLFRDSRATMLPAVQGWLNPLVFAVGDVDADGTSEVIVTRTKGQLGDADFYQGFYVQVLRLSGRTVTDVTSSVAPTLNASAATVIRDAQNVPTWIEWVWLADYDGDGKKDLIASSEHLGKFWAKNTGTSLGAWTKL